MIGCEHGQPNLGVNCVACNKQRVAELEQEKEAWKISQRAYKTEAEALRAENQRLRVAIQAHRGSFIGQEGDIVPEDEILWAALEGGE